MAKTDTERTRDYKNRIIKAGGGRIDITMRSGEFYKWNLLRDSFQLNNIELNKVLLNIAFDALKKNPDDFYKILNENLPREKRVNRQLSVDDIMREAATNSGE